MSNSSLVDIKILSPNHSGRRNQPITKIAIHHTAGAITADTIGRIFEPTSRMASCNYGIGRDNKIVLCVDEANRSWCTSSSWCDNRAITIEVSNSSNGGNWPVSDEVISTLIDLVTDICKRNGIKNCTYTGGKDGVLQKHEWYSNTNCPGPYLGSKFSYIASEVNKRLEGGSLNTTITSTSNSNVKSVDEIAREVIDGEWGNGSDRANRLTSAGYDYDEVQDRVNEILGGNSTYSSGKSIDEIAREVIDGEWGNGSDRVNRLTSAGYDYDEVQDRVNEILGGAKSKSTRKSIDTLAREVIRGDWGNGRDRKNRLEKAGYDYDEVQRRVNEIL